MMPSLLQRFTAPSRDLKKLALLLLLGAAVVLAISLLAPSSTGPAVAPSTGQVQELAGWMIQAVARYDLERQALLERQLTQVTRQIDQFTQGRAGRLQEQFGEAIVHTHRRLRAEWIRLRNELAATTRELRQITDTRSARWQEQLGKAVVSTAQRVPDGGAAFQEGLNKEVARLEYIAERTADRLRAQAETLRQQQAAFPSLIPFFYREAIGSARRSARMFDEAHLAWATRLHAALDEQAAWQRTPSAYTELVSAAQAVLAGPAGVGGFMEFGAQALAGLVFAMVWFGAVMRREWWGVVEQPSTAHPQPLLREHRSSRNEVNHMVQPVMMFSWPKKVIVGNNVSGEIGRYAARDQIRKALLITDRNINHNGHLEPLKSSLSNAGIGWSVYDRVAHEVPDTDVNTVYEVCQHTETDLLVAVGGGSVIDTAKAVGILVANGGMIQDYEGVDKVPNPLPHFYAVPTTTGAGCSSATSQFCFVLDTKRKKKLEIISRRVIPQMVLIDPSLMVTMAPELTASSGIDALTNAIEAYFSTWASPLTDTLALHAIRLISGALRAAVVNGKNLEARRQMALAAFEAGLAFNNAQCGAAHALGHPLAGLFDVPERLSEAILLPHVMRYNLNADMARMAEVAVAMGEPVDGLSPRAAAERAIAAVQWLLADIGLPSTLGKVGVAKEAIPELTRQAAQDTFLRTNLRVLRPRDIEEIYLHAFEETDGGPYGSMNEGKETVH